VPRRRGSASGPLNHRATAVLPSTRHGPTAAATTSRNAIPVNQLTKDKAIPKVPNCSKLCVTVTRIQTDPAAA
jgi:hypothetical protein